MAKNETPRLPSTTLWANGTDFNEAFTVGFLPFDNEEIAHDARLTVENDEVAPILAEETFAAVFSLFPEELSFMNNELMIPTATLWATGIDWKDAFAEGFIPFDTEDTAQQVAQQTGEDVFEAIFIMTQRL